MLSHKISGTWLGGPREIEKRREKKEKGRREKGGRKGERKERGRDGGEERLLYLFDKHKGCVL